MSNPDNFFDKQTQAVGFIYTIVVLGVLAVAFLISIRFVSLYFDIRIKFGKRA